MRVCTARQMAAIDAETINGGTAGSVLMERAGKKMTQQLLVFLQDRQLDGRVLVICGKGNNGGDGLVLARLLREQGRSVAVMMLAENDDLSPDAQLNYGRLPAGVDILHPGPNHWTGAVGPLLEEAAVVVDAIFGTGITPPLRQPYVDLFRTLNQASAPRVALDIPSGVSGDDGSVDPVAVFADLTITVGLPKRGLLLAPGRDFTGKIKVVDIGFPTEISDRHSENHHWLTRQDYLALLPPRPTTGHKYDFGCLTILAGSRAFGGAACLTGLGALRSGAGLVKLAAPLELLDSLRGHLPEALCVGLATTASGTIEKVPTAVMDDLLRKQDAVVLGPGLGADNNTDQWVVEFLAGLKKPLLVDADGLGAFSRSGNEPRFNSDAVVLTPHAGELGRLVGLSSAEVMAQRLVLVPKLAARWNVVLMLKGSPSLIGAPDGRLFFNPTGDDTLARGGSGDVLSGLIGGLLAQGRSALEAALLGAYLLGVAGFVAAAESSSRSVLVREVAAALGPAFGAMETEAAADPELRHLIRPLSGKE